MIDPARGFEPAEFEARCARAQQMMRAERLDALLLTTEPRVRYFSGFLTQFWQSPTRPWFLVLPAEGKPIAVIPGIGEAGMRSTWLDDVRCWQSPAPDDDGVTLLAKTINGLPARFGRLGACLGIESYLRMPVRDWGRLCDRLDGLEIADCALLMHRLCSVKSPAEVERIERACQLVSDSFAALPEFARIGDGERDIVRAMRIDLLQRGIDHSPYVACASGADGYGDIIMGPGDRQIEAGDLLIIDTGSVYDGYFSDFDRNFAFGSASARTREVHECIWRATEAGFAAARPGATTAELWRAMWAVLEAGGARGNDIGRMGHGLGAQLTEWPSLMPTDQTRLEPGMVITLEPGMNYDHGKLMVHEENIVITEDGARMLSRRAAAEIPVID